MVGLVEVSAYRHVRLAQTVVELGPPTAQPLRQLTITLFYAQPSATTATPTCPHTHHETDCVATLAIGQRFTGTSEQ
jgi:hypothetical protein